MPEVVCIRYIHVVTAILLLFMFRHALKTTQIRQITKNNDSDTWILNVFLRLLFYIVFDAK